MTTRTPNSADIAQHAVSALVAVSLGAPYAAEKDAAMKAIAALRQEAMNQLSRFEPRSADVLAYFDFIIQTLKKQEFGVFLANLFPRVVEAHHDLARLLLDPSVVDRVRAYADTPGVSNAGELAELVYVQQCAESLIGRDEFEPAATLLCRTSIELADQAAAAVDRHEAYARSEQERIEAEQRAAQAEIDRAERDRRGALITFFGARDGQRFIVRSRVFSGKGLSQIARGNGARDEDRGEYPSPAVSVDELENVMRRARAAELATGPEAA